MKTASPQLDFSGHILTLDRPRIMGVLNVTPDSFSDGGQWLNAADAVRHALDMQQEGADIIDVGGESTRPGALAVSLQEELDRVIPIIEAIASRLDIPVCVDTSKAEVMRAAVSAGAGMVNDVFALRKDGALQAAAQLSVPVCLMHMQGEPRMMQDNPHYTDVAIEVNEFLQNRAEQCLVAGVKPHNIVLDPGFGFGKTLQQNLTLFQAIPMLTASVYPLLVGVSRKGMIGQLTGRELAGRLPGSVVAAALAVVSGAAIMRVHDVAASCDAIKVATALRPANA